jgi:hypothetical protein
VVALAAWALISGPKSAKVFVLVSVLSLPVAYPPVSKITEWLWSPDIIYLLVLNAQDIDGGIELHELTEAEWADLELEGDGRLEQIPAKVPLYLARTFDREELTATATWRGSTNDLELLRNEEKIDEVRNLLEPRAKIGLAHKVKYRSIIREATMTIVGHIIETSEKATMPRGDAISEAIDDAIPETMGDPSDDGKDVDSDKIEEEQPPQTDDPAGPQSDFDLDAAAEAGVTGASGGGQQ